MPADHEHLQGEQGLIMAAYNQMSLELLGFACFLLLCQVAHANAACRGTHVNASNTNTIAFTHMSIIDVSADCPNVQHQVPQQMTLRCDTHVTM